MENVVGQVVGVAMTAVAGVVTWVTRETVQQGRQIATLVARLDASDKHARERHQEIREDLSGLRSELRGALRLSSRGPSYPRPTDTPDG